MAATSSTQSCSEVMPGVKEDVSDVSDVDMLRAKV